MRNKTEQFKKKYNSQLPANNPDHNPIKKQQKTFYRSTCNINNPITETHISLRSQRQLINKKCTSTNFFGNTGSRKLIVKQKKVEGLKRQNEKTEVSIKGMIEEMPLTTHDSISDVKWKQIKPISLMEESGSTIIENLGKNQLFFCCSCYQYIFQIEKSRHHPTCRDKLLFEQIDRQKILEICWQRLERIVSLSQYTQTRKRDVEDLWQQAKKSQFSRMLLINYPQSRQFFKLDQILMAFVYTYEHLLKGKVPKKKSNFFNCF